MKHIFPRLLLTCALGLAALPSHLDAQVFYFGSERWPINDPFADANASKDPNKGTIRNNQVFMTKRIGNVSADVSKRLTEVTRIEWGAARLKVMQLAEEEVLRGDGARALEYIEPVLRFFDPLKKVPGSLWLPAASIKLDALVLLKNDVVLDDFVRELEPLNDGSILGLNDKIAMIKIGQKIRKGFAKAALADINKMISDTANLDHIANLNLLKGNALLGLSRYEDAMETFLRIPVFYGSQTKYIPTSLLGATKAFRGMNTPSNRHLRLDEVINGYLVEIITTYPYSKEAAEARNMLPRNIRESLDKKAADDSEMEEATVVISPTPENGD